MANRRSFLQQSSALIGAGVVLSAFDNKAFAKFKKLVSPSDQINIGAIGINGMGWANVQAAIKVPGVNLLALCDVDKNVLDKRMAELPKM
ncbi:MAG TPA: twin-arginine translocation signal domain-containing protein, partial [Puia sp.]|nr:twin-arginine translocation signal domain-containing protein [Puia sp.]